MNHNGNERLQTMLRQVDPALNAAGLRESLTSPEMGLEAEAAEAVDFEAELALESLDALRRDQPIDDQSQFGLEAIVMPFYRPVVDIVDNAMSVAQLTSKWNHLGEGAVKARIEKTFLSIGRVEIPQHPFLPYAGTGFVVGRKAGGGHLLMTNRHVAEIFSRGLGARNLTFVPGQQVNVDFFRELGNAATESLRVQQVLMIHPYWDMALLEVSGLPATREPLQLLTDDPTRLQGREVVTVGYPGYDPSGDLVYQQTLTRVFRGIYYVKRMQPGVYRVRENVTSYERAVSAVTHDCSTLGGNSGSAVIDVATGNVVGLHFAGAYLRANYAVSPYDLAQDARVVDTGIAFTRPLQASSFYTPYWSSAEQSETEAAKTPPAAQPATGVAAPASPISHQTLAVPVVASVDSSDARMTAGRATPTVEIEIPIKIALSIESPKLAAPISNTPVAPILGAESATQPSASESLQGFDVEFLSSRVEPPQLQAVDLNDAVRVNNLPLIHHTHFSVCQSISRRLPRFVAWNIDGNQLRSISRRGLDFTFDDQISSQFQIGDELYKNNDYDRGHIARRADLVWGDVAEAKRANRESFFFTNIAPQHKRFNQSGLAGLWGELENAIFEDVDVHDLRISTIAGPIFKPDDPVYRGVQIPRDFWKLIAFDDDADGQFKVAAYILTQRDLVETEALELDAFQLHQVSLTQLSAETGLGFGDLAAHDTFGGRVEVISSIQRREIGSRDQLLKWSDSSPASESTSSASLRKGAPFDVSSLAAPGFSWQAALALAHCSKLAYEPAESVRHIAVNNWGFEEAQFIEVGETQCFIATTPAAIVLSFRGTENVPDWLTNLTLFSTARPYGSVHRGFAKAFDLVRTAVHAQLAAETGGTRRLLITGHSLGGALATIAAAEFQSEFSIDGIYTYGQPRLGKSDFQDFITQHFTDRFHRIVNDDDIVTRVPPGYAHVGKLFHLDADGALIESMLESTITASPEPEPLTEPEFRALQEQLRVAQAATRTSLESAPAPIDEREVVNATMEGLFPSFSDHAIKRYIAKIRLLATDSGAAVVGESAHGFATESLQFGSAKRVFIRSRKIDPDLEAVSQDWSVRPRIGQLEAIEGGAGLESAWTASRGGLGSPVLLRLKSPDWVAPEGMTIHSRIGNFATAHCTADQLETLRVDPEVLSVEASRDAGVPEVDTSVAFIGATDVHKPPISEKGSLAIVGLIDSGIDILHEAFLDDVGKTRILGIWNQRESAIPGSPYQSPKNTLAGAFTQDYGVLYLKNQLDDLIAGAGGAVPPMLRDPGLGGGPGHGTHVASIAAGREAGNFKGGVAPDAKILVVIPNMATNPADPPSLGYSNSHVDALSFLIAAAKEPTIGSGLPIAINVSLGMNAGAHDGLSLLEASFDAATGNGRHEGVVIVKSAGNEGNSGGHAELQAFNGKQFISWESTADFRQRDYIEVWFNSQHELKFKLIDPLGNPSPTISAANPRTSALLGGNRCAVLLTEFHQDCGDHRLQITIAPENATIQTGAWRLEVTGLAVGGGNQSVHAWVERDIARAVRFQTGDNNAMTLSVPGTAKHVITVTASGSGLPLLLTPSSSQGLTRDGRAKPDLCAPGTAIRAAASNTNDHRAIVPMTGTSMAAPHVTGTVALAFSMRNRLGRRQLTANSTAGMLRRYAHGGNGTHNRAFGFGCLAAGKFLEAVQLLP